MAPLALPRIRDNAVRYGGGARVDARRQDGAVLLTVEDDGPGAPDEALERLTEAFERLEPSRGRRDGGAGLGLAIVRALAERDDGALSLANRVQGGLSAQVRLPRA